MFEMTVEEMAYALGELYSKAPSKKEEADDLIGKLRDKGILLEDNYMGNGWKVLEVTGRVMIYENVAHLVWSSKGYAWSFWMGMGEPSGMMLCCISLPDVEIDAVRMGVQSGFEGVKGKPFLRAVK